MEANNTSFERLAVMKVWCRTARAEKEMPVNAAERSVAQGLADFVGPGSLPLDKSARAGGRTAGDGEGHAHVEPMYRPGTVILVPLAVARRMVMNGIGRYVSPDGGRPIVPDHEPVMVAGASARRVSGRLGSTIL